MKNIFYICSDTNSQFANRELVSLNNLFIKVIIPLNIC